MILTLQTVRGLWFFFPFTTSEKETERKSNINSQPMIVFIQLLTGQLIFFLDISHFPIGTSYRLLQIRLIYTCIFSFSSFRPLSAFPQLNLPACAIVRAARHVDPLLFLLREFIFFRFQLNISLVRSHDILLETNDPVSHCSTYMKEQLWPQYPSSCSCWKYINYKLKNKFT